MSSSTLSEISSTDVENRIHAINHGALLLCKKGTATLNINSERWAIGAETLVSFFPGDVVIWEDISSDFHGLILRYTPAQLREACRNMEHAIYSLLRQDRCCHIKELIDTVVYSLFNIVKFHFRMPACSVTDEVVVLQLRSFFLGFYDYIKRSRLGEAKEDSNRTSELFNQFMELLETEYHEGHEVNYYARRMNITRKYLSMIVRRKTSRSPKRIIDEYIVLRLKLAFRSTPASIKQVASDFYFNDPSFLARYFKERTGLTPSQYKGKFR